MYRQLMDIVLIDEPTLQARISELAKQISEDYGGCKDLLLVCVLRGGVIFLTDLMRRLTIPHEIDFMAVTSYASQVRRSSGIVRILMDLKSNIEGRNVLIVEDIINSGNTLDYILRVLRERQPTTLEVCSLLSKSERRRVDIPVKYLGFEIADEFVFGYGLDLHEQWRNLPFVAIARTDQISPIKN